MNTTVLNNISSSLALTLRIQMITRRDIIIDTISNGAGGACEGGYSSGNSGSCAIIKPATVTRNQQLTECTLDTYAIESPLNRDMEERETSLRE